jgi:hypothetical protein
VESWSKGSETREPKQLGQLSSYPAKSAERMGREKCGERGCIEKGNSLGCAMQSPMDTVGQTTHSPTNMGALSHDAAIGTSLNRI